MYICKGLLIEINENVHWIRNNYVTINKKFQHQIEKKSPKYVSFVNNYSFKKHCYNEHSFGQQNTQYLIILGWNLELEMLTLVSDLMWAFLYSGFLRILYVL